MRFITVLVALFIFSACQFNQKYSPITVPGQKAKNVVLFIGDGMGPTVITATRLHYKGSKGQLFMEGLPHMAKVTTYADKYMVTDSAAGATAMATGQKVENGVLSMKGASPPKMKSFPIGTDKKGTEIQTIMDLAVKAGKSVGVVTTANVLHATPAAFYAHTNFRKDYDSIMKQLAKSDMKIALGGGAKQVLSRTDLFKGRILKTKISELDKCSEKPVVGVFAKKHLAYSFDDKKSFKKFKKMSSFALKCLSKNPNGFVLMVEGARIDMALHRRKIAHAVEETKNFDQVIERSVKFLKKKSLLKDTLILVTADHDTGGVGINGKTIEGEKFWKKKGKGVKYTVKESLTDKKIKYRLIKLSNDGGGSFQHITTKAPHTAHDVHLYGMGPGAQNVKGMINNIDIFQIMKTSLNLSEK